MDSRPLHFHKGNHRGSSLIINFCETLAQEPDSTGRGLVQEKKEQAPKKTATARYPNLTKVVPHFKQQGRFRLVQALLFDPICSFLGSAPVPVSWVSVLFEAVSQTVIELSERVVPESQTDASGTGSKSGPPPFFSATSSFQHQR